MTTPMFSRVWMDRREVIPSAKYVPKRSGARKQARKLRKIRTAKSPTTKATPISPNSSPMTEKMKSVCTSGR